MGLSAETTFHLKIASNQAPVVDQQVPAQRIEEGQVFSYTVPDQVFSDPDGLGGGTLSAGGMPAWMQFDAQTRVLSGTPAYADLGQYNITLTWTDDGGLSVTTPLALTVAAAADLTLGGTAGNDVLVGDSGSDTLTGLGGNGRRQRRRQLCSRPCRRPGDRKRRGRRRPGQRQRQLYAGCERRTAGLDR
jgi:hypothetical protein